MSQHDAGIHGATTKERDSNIMRHFSEVFSQKMPIVKGHGLTTTCVNCGKNPITERYNPCCSERCTNQWRGNPI